MTPPAGGGASPAGPDHPAGPGHGAPPTSPASPASPATPGDAVVPIEDLLLLPGTLLLATWTSQEPLAQLPAALQGRLADLLDELAVLYGPAAAACRQAAQAGDGRAWAALVQLDAGHGQALDRLMPRIEQAKRQRDWPRLDHEARLAVHLATASGRDADLALAAHLLANARAAQGDLAGAVQPFRRSIAAAARARLPKLQSVGHGNLGNALRDAGDCDAALAEYAAALDLEADPRGRAVVQANRAVALQRLGERASALQALLAQIDALEAAGAPAFERVVTLGRAAHATLEAGDARQARILLDRAEALAEAGDLPGRAMLAALRARAAGMLDDTAAADRALEQAWQLALDHAVDRLQPLAPRYAQGFDAALAHRLPTQQALQLMMPAIADKDANRWPRALQGLRAAETQARQAGDLALALRIAANRASALLDAGQMATALHELQAVQAESAARGLARPEAMAWGSMAAVAAQTGELVMGLDLNGLLALAAALMDLHGQLLAASALPEADQAFEAMHLELGVLVNERALLAQRCGAWSQAARHFDHAAALVRRFGPSFPLANRLAGLLDACTHSHDAPLAAKVATELAALLRQLEPRARLVAERALAQHLDTSDAARALTHWLDAAALAEQLRVGLPAGLDASQVNRGFSRLPMQAAQRLRRAGRTAEAWQLLQQGRARRLLDARAPGQPLPTLDEVRGALPPGELLVDVAIEDDGVAAYLLSADGFDTLFEPMDVDSLATPELADLRQREAALLALARGHAGLAALAARIMARGARGRPLLLVPDGPLHNLPLHEIRIGGHPWHELQPIGLLPCAAWLQRVPPWPASTCLVAGDSAGDLRGAEAECRSVAHELGASAFTGERCTREAIEAALAAGPLDIVHLAVHGRGDAQRGARASLLLADGLGGTTWVPFEALVQRPWRANLVVLSGCSTGVAGPLHGHEMVSVARAALEAGAGSVLASLWPVDDQIAAAFMVALHASLAGQRRRADGDLRVAIDEARQRIEVPVPTAADGGGRRDGHPTRGLTATAPQVAPGSESDETLAARPVTPTPASPTTVPLRGTAAPLDAVAAFVLVGRPTLPRRAEPASQTG